MRIRIYTYMCKVLSASASNAIDAVFISIIVCIVICLIIRLSSCVVLCIIIRVLHVLYAVSALYVNRKELASIVTTKRSTANKQTHKQLNPPPKLSFDLRVCGPPYPLIYTRGAFQYLD